MGKDYTCLCEHRFWSYSHLYFYTLRSIASFQKSFCNAKSKNGTSYFLKETFLVKGYVFLRLFPTVFIAGYFGFNHIICFLFILVSVTTAQVVNKRFSHLNIPIRTR